MTLTLPTDTSGIRFLARQDEQEDREERASEEAYAELARSVTGKALVEFLRATRARWIETSPPSQFHELTLEHRLCDELLNTLGGADFPALFEQLSALKG